MADGCCKPHVLIPTEQQHRLHHWAERLKCAAFCIVVHIAYEVAMYAWF